MSFEAVYESTCVECGERIHRGDLIQSDSARDGDGFNRTVYVHVDCDDSVEETDLDRDSKREVCPSCFLIKPCECEGS